MATVFSGKEFEVYISHDDTASGVGVFNISDDSNRYKLDIDSFSFPNFNPAQEFEIRSGAGRIVDVDSIFSTNIGVITDVSLSGRLTNNDLPIFFENILQDQQDANGVLAVPYNYSPEAWDFADTITTGKFDRTLSLFFKSPSSANSWKMFGCTVTSISLGGDIGTAGGRVNYDVTLSTGFTPTEGTQAVASATGIGTTKYFMTDWVSRTIASVSNPLITAFGVTVNSPTVYLGAQGGKEDPEIIAKAVPELEVTYSATMKYDSTSAGLFEDWAVNETNVSFYLSDKAISGSTFPTDAGALGINIPNSRLTSVSFNSEDIATLSIEGKGAYSGTTNALEVQVAQ